jgi:hypothetical protein
MHCGGTRSRAFLSITLFPGVTLVGALGAGQREEAVSIRRGRG